MNNNTWSGAAVTVGAAVLCAAVVAGIVMMIALMSGSKTSAHASGSHRTYDPKPAHAANLQPAQPTQVRPAPQPSSQMETLQRELGQLNYYNGAITGYLNSQTTQAITYLQRDAHLPQTGQMNAATERALANYMANGNNQMGS